VAVAGGIGLLWLWENVAVSRIPAVAKNRVYGFAGVLVVVLVWGLSAYTSLPTPPLNKDDVAVLDWIKLNTPPDAMMLTPDDDRYGHWKIIMTERQPQVMSETDPLPAEAYSSLLTIDTHLPNWSQLPADSTSEIVFQSGEARAYRIVSGNK
jgi:hypothetical protein